MKVTINIDCTPQEARTFLGLPDFEPMHKTLSEAMESRLSEAIRAMDADTLLKVWTPGGVKGLEELQKAFWAGFTSEKGKDSGGS